MIAVLNALETIGDFPAAYWERPKDGQMVFKDPPYALCRPYPSAGEFDGPLSDTRVDIVLRVQVLSVGKTMREAMRVADATRRVMVVSVMEPLLIVATSAGVDPVPRVIQDLRHMVVSGGISRDDDLPSPFYYDTDLYEMVTTPR